MNRYLLTILIFFTFSSIHAQSLDSKSIQFLDWFFNSQRKVSSGKNFYLANGISDHDIKGLKICFSTDTLIHLSRSLEEARTPRYLILNDKQKASLLNSISKIKSTPLPKSILPSMKLLDSIKYNQLFNDSNRHEAWNNAYLSKIFGYYSFNAPIFFGSEYCLFKYNYSCGWLCGDGTTIIYRKTKTGWERWIELDNWIS